MKINEARSKMALIALLYRLGIVSYEFADKYADFLTVLVVTEEMKAK